jgi:pentatricopeptide repeat protein
MFRGIHQIEKGEGPPSALQMIEREQAKLQLETSANEVNVKCSFHTSSFPLSDPSFKSVIVDLIENQHWSQLKPLLKPTSPSHFLQQLFDSNLPIDTIFTFFKWSQHEFQISHSLPHFCKLLTLLAHDKKYSKIRSLLHTFVKYWQLNSNSSFFHALVTCSNDFCVNSVIVDMLILACVNNNKLDLALEGFKRSVNYGIKLSLVSCNPMLGKLVEEGKVRVLEFVFREMIKRRVEINLITLNTVINGFCKAGKLNKAGDVVEDMKIWGLLPNVVTYNTWINGFCRKGGVGKLYKADALLKEMVEKGVNPNEITYTIL